MTELESNELGNAIWAGKFLFERGKLSGSAGNISFKMDGKIFISRSGATLGNMNSSDFSVSDLSGKWLEGPKPSKELPLHVIVYSHKPECGAVIHTHSFYSVLWSCLENGSETNCIPSYTPYLKMKVGTVGLIPYAPPGSQKLFYLFEQKVNNSSAYLLRNHGPVVGGRNVVDAFNCIEELEESAKLAVYLKSICGDGAETIDVGDLNSPF
ncbi:MAG: class II aldolase/adducin family protein [Oscillospiraceae bacterium]